MISLGSYCLLLDSLGSRTCAVDVLVSQAKFSVVYLESISRDVFYSSIQAERPPLSFAFLHSNKLFNVHHLNLTKDKILRLVCGTQD